MNNTQKISFSSAWLIAGLLSLVLPIYLPSSPGSDVIGLATAVLNILAFPLGLFAIPIRYISQIVLGVDPQSIAGQYLNLFVLFVIGLVQWFAVVPKLIFGETSAKTTEMLPRAPERELGEPVRTVEFATFDADLRSPVERLLSDRDR